MANSRRGANWMRKHKPSTWSSRAEGIIYINLHKRHIAYIRSFSKAWLRRLSLTLTHYYITYTFLQLEKATFLANIYSSNNIVSKLTSVCGDARACWAAAPPAACWVDWPATDSSSAPSPRRSSGVWPGKTEKNIAKIRNMNLYIYSNHKSFCLLLRDNSRAGSMYV